MKYLCLVYGAESEAAVDRLDHADQQDQTRGCCLERRVETRVVKVVVGPIGPAKETRGGSPAVREIVDPPPILAG